MNPLLVILSHSKANETFARHLPYYLRCGCDILPVGREDTDCIFTRPEAHVLMPVNIGKEAYVDGDNHIRRFLMALHYALTLQAHYETIAIAEYDFVPFRPMPPHEGGFAAKHMGYKSKGFLANNYFHGPWVFDRPTAHKFIEYGYRLLAADLIELGFIDRWIGLLTQLYAIPVGETQTYSRNTLDKPEHIAEAKEALKHGAWGVHGIKSKAQLDALNFTTAEPGLWISNKSAA